VTVEVKDKDVFGSDDFMGQVVLTLSDFADGKEHTVVELLRDEVLPVLLLTITELYIIYMQNNLKLPDDDRGEVEIRIRYKTFHLLL
jgi:hypothetical protein